MKDDPENEANMTAPSDHADGSQPSVDEAVQPTLESNPADASVAELTEEPTEEPIGVDSQITLADARRAIEAILMVADQPVTSALLAQLLEVPIAGVESLCSEMATDYESLGHGFQLVLVAGGWRFQSHPAQAAYVERFALDGQVSRLSAAALETLAIVAYKQPISRAQIAQIRGVNVDGVMRTLVQRGYVAEIGTDPGPGQASLFGTTTKFLEGVGLGSLADLAPLADFVPGAEILDALEAGLRVDTTVDTSIDPPSDDAPVSSADSSEPSATLPG
jgi:segregation and condensation protein B